jgi:hypothetical protein
METHVESNLGVALQNLWRMLFTLLLLAALPQGDVMALTINVVGPANEVVADYRWLVEEDATKASIPNVPTDASNRSLRQYLNGDLGQSIKQQLGQISNIAMAPAMDEGGNQLDVRFGPLTLHHRTCVTPGSCPPCGDYRLQVYGGIGANS